MYKMKSWLIQDVVRSSPVTCMMVVSFKADIHLSLCHTGPGEAAWENQTSIFSISLEFFYLVYTFYLSAIHKNADMCSMVKKSIVAKLRPALLYKSSIT